MVLETKVINIEYIRGLFYRDPYIIVSVEKNNLIFYSESPMLKKIAYLPLLNIEGEVSAFMSFSITQSIIIGMVENTVIRFEIDVSNLIITVYDEMKQNILAIYDTILQSTSFVQIGSIVDKLRGAHEYPKIHIQDLEIFARITQKNRYPITIEDNIAFTNYLGCTVLKKTELTNLSLFSEPLHLALKAIPTRKRNDEDKLKIYNVKNEIIMIVDNIAIILEKTLPQLTSSKSLLARKKFSSEYQMDIKSLLNMKISNKELERIKIDIGKKRIKFSYNNYSQLVPIEITEVSTTDKSLGFGKQYPIIEIPIEIYLGLILPMKKGVLSFLLSPKLFACKIEDYIIVGGRSEQ